MLFFFSFAYLSSVLFVLSACCVYVVVWLNLPGDSLGDTGDLAGPALGVRALLLPPSGALTWEQGDRWGPAGVWAPVPERCEEEREEQGEVVAPEPAVLITAECSGVCRPMADRMLFPFIPGSADRQRERVLRMEGVTRGYGNGAWESWSTENTSGLCKIQILRVGPNSWVAI